MRQLRYIAALCALLCCSLPAWADGYTHRDIVFAATGRPVSGATITVCASGATWTATTVCSPVTTIYTDSTLGTPKANPFTSDGRGNFDFSVPFGATYVVSISGTSIRTYSYKLTSTFPNTLASPTITSPTITGTDSGAETLSNKTLTAPVINGTPTGTGIPTITAKSGTGAGAYSTASATFVDVDNTNLALTVTIPTGWKLSVTATGVCGQLTAAAGLFIGIFDSVANTTANNLNPVPATINVNLPFTTQRVITGDGMSHTVSLRYATANVSDSAVINNGGGTAVIPQMVFRLEPSN